MKIPEYVTREEVQRICSELKISDWTKKPVPEVSPEEAEIILSLVNREGMDIEQEEFRAGLEIELEHGIQFEDANVTNNHPLLTGLIVLAHLKESLDYYKLLEVAELEGDLLKAVAANNSEKTMKYYKKLAEAKIALSRAELKRLDKKH